MGLCLFHLKADFAGGPLRVVMTEVGHSHTPIAVHRSLLLRGAENHCIFTSRIIRLLSLIYMYIFYSAGRRQSLMTWILSATHQVSVLKFDKNSLGS